MGRKRINEANKESSAYGKPMGRPRGTTGIKKRVKENRKIKCHFSISKEADEVLSNLSEKRGLSKSEIVDKAVLKYFNGESL